MSVRVALMALVLGSGGLGLAVPSPARASAGPMLKNPAVLNIGFVCRWQDPCIRKQKVAMVYALKFVDYYRPPAWRIQQCNRNASRGGTRVDWIGFNNCVRNANLQPPSRKRRRR